MQKFNGSLIRQFPSLVSGNAAAGVQVTVYVSGTNTLAAIYDDNEVTPKGNPITTASNGFYSFKAADGKYRLQFSSSQFPSLEIQLVDVEEIRQDFDDLQNSFDDFVLSQGWDQVGTFAAGFTYTSPNQVGQDAGGNWWRWNGAFPKAVAAGTLPSSDANYKLVGDGVLRNDLAATNSTVLVGGIEAWLIAKRSLVWRTPAEFGASGDGVDYSVQVQAAFDSGFPIIFDKDYTASHVKIRGEGKVITFNGYSLQPPSGPKVTTENFLLDITCRASDLYLIKVNVAFLPYEGAIRWHSLSAGNPSNNNNIYGMYPIYALTGLVYGNLPGQPVVDAAHSENTVYGFKCRGVRTPFVGNQPNGFLTMVAPILDCNPNEYASQPDFATLNWNSTSRSFLNLETALAIKGGEVLKTFTQDGYGFEGAGFKTIGTTFECAGTRGLFRGGATISKSLGGFMSSDSRPLYEAATGATGTVTLDDDQCYRADGVSSYSGANIFDNNATNGIRLVAKDCYFYEWRINRLGSAKADYFNCTFEHQGSAPLVFGIEQSNKINVSTINSWTASRQVTVNRTVSGRVIMSGVVGGGVSGTAACTLPADYRPSAQTPFSVVAENSTGGTFMATVFINTDGNIIIVSPSTTDFIHLNQVEFSL